MNVGECKVCGQQFYSVGLIDGKCQTCRDKYPNAKTKADIEPAKAKEPLEARVLEAIQEAVSEAIAKTTKQSKKGENNG